MRCALAASVLVTLTMPGQALAQPAPASPADAVRDAGLRRLERELARVAQVAGGTLGVTAIHVESARRVSINGDVRFPMASTFKVPIAIQLLTRVEKGEVRLDELIPLQASDYHPGSGSLTELFGRPGVSLSVRNLLELMLLVSDNSATDIVLRLAGGPETVTARMLALGIEGINVSRPTIEIIADWSGVTLPPVSERAPEAMTRLMKAVPPDQARLAAERFDADTRDTSTPDAMASLLLRLYKKELLSASESDLLLDIMRRCQTGNARLKGLLPEGTEVAHKTGTIGGTTNDVGIMTLPDGAGHVIVAAFVKGSDKEIPVRERGIAEVARAAHDYFLFHPEPGS